jgi:hypothetical protein
MYSHDLAPLLMQNLRLLINMYINLNPEGHTFYDITNKAQFVLHGNSTATDTSNTMNVKRHFQKPISHTNSIHIILNQN